MARLDKKDYPMSELFFGEKWKESHAQQEEELNDIPLEKLYFEPVADGRAYYFVKSEKPPILMHIPYGDCYQLPPAHIRGLRLSDIKQFQESQRALEQIFGDKK